MRIVTPPRAALHSSGLVVAGLLIFIGFVLHPNAISKAQNASSDASSSPRAAAEAPTTQPGWTGASHASDIIATRRALMLELERLIRPLDHYTAGEPGDPDALREAAGTISTLLLAVPHLFPPPTNVYDPNEEIPTTLALPAIWQDFPAFYSLAETAAHAASDALTASDAELPAAALRLRGTCDACHAVFMREYDEPAVTSEDLEFDFESVFPFE